MFLVVLLHLYASAIASESSQVQFIRLVEQESNILLAQFGTFSVVECDGHLAEVGKGLGQFGVAAVCRRVTAQTAVVCLQ